MTLEKYTIVPSCSQLTQLIFIILSNFTTELFLLLVGLNICHQLVYEYNISCSSGLTRVISSKDGWY